MVQVGEAMQKMHDRKNIGKLVLDPSLEPKPKPATPAKGKAGKEKKPTKESSEEKKDKETKEEEKKENGDKNGEDNLTNGNSDEGQSRTIVTKACVDAYYWIRAINAACVVRSRFI